MLRFCERELYDIEICQNCYLRSNTYSDNSWFVDACERPHLLVWAKMNGSNEPYWPGKTVAWKNGLVDVRFFGDHACAFVPAANVLLYSKENPNKRVSVTNQKLLDCCLKVNRLFGFFFFVEANNNLKALFCFYGFQEVDKYIASLNEKFSLFKFMPPKTKFDPEKIYIHLHQMLPYLYIEESFEYFRKMKDFIKRTAKQPEKLSLGYSLDGVSLGLKPLSVVMHRLESGSVSDNQDNDESDVNDLAESIENTMNIKTKSIQSRKTIGPDTDQDTVMISSSDSENDDEGDTEVTMIEVGLNPETDKKQAPTDNDSLQNNTTVRLIPVPKNSERTQSSKTNERYEEPAISKPNPSMPSSSSMPVIDETDESVTHERDAIASETSSTTLNGSLSNVAATNTALDDDEDWREIKLLLTRKMKKDHRLEQQHYQETLNDAKTKIKKLKERNKVLEIENEHWKISVRDSNAKIREKDADLKKQSEENKETVNKLEIEYAAKIDAMKLQLDEQWRNKKWCPLCGKEIGAEFLNSKFCSISCMRQSWRV